MTLECHSHVDNSLFNLLIILQSKTWNEYRADFTSVPTSQEISTFMAFLEKSQLGQFVNPKDTFGVHLIMCNY